MSRVHFLSLLSRKAVKHAPALCVGVGAIGVVAATVLTAKTTYEKKDDIDKCKESIEATKEWTSEEEPKVRRKELAKTYLKTSGSIMKIYALPAGVGITGLCVMLYGHRILSKRHLALIASYETLNQSYKKYRNNIREEFGEVKDVETAYDMKAEYLNDEPIFIPDRDLSDFAVFFGQGYSALIDSDTNPDNDPEVNFRLLRELEEAANDIFNQRGYLFLSDVYSMLGLLYKYPPEGIGWCKGRGDDYISFGIFNVKNANAISGDEDIFLLDFNHDGYILPYI